MIVSSSVLLCRHAPRRRRRRLPSVVVSVSSTWFVACVVVLLLVGLTTSVSGREQQRREKQKQRRACSNGCEDGFYEAAPCTNFGDRECKECTKCEGAMYEARPCGETTDRQCMHVAHPLLIAGEQTTPVFLEGLKVEASENVFLEDLHYQKNLETTYYVTDTTQAYDFFWLRDSGLQVNIGLLEIHLIPEYEDVDHENDNEYMLTNPNNSEDKTKFRQIVDGHCRNPIPDYYSVTLEISRDRITTAGELVCDSQDPSVPPCPEGYTDGDVYLHRTLNDACPKMAKGTFPEELVPAPNSIVCTENTDLLRTIFNQSYTREQPIRFPPRRCKTAQARCDQCLEQPRCRVLDVFEQKCCQIDCYTLPDCKLTQSEECTSAPVECAMGDAYRYTIQPVFQNVKQNYMCHIKRKEPRILYQIFFFVQIPEKQFQTPKVYKTIYAQDLSYHSRGEYNADYITVEHDTGLNLQDEFILIGQEHAQGSADSAPAGGGALHFNHSVHNLKDPQDFRKKRVVIHEISPNIFVASTQFERPFDFSTSSWNKKSCDKNITKFQKVQRRYGSEGQPVSVMTTTKEEPYSYYLKSIPDPYIRFKVPGNMSILPYYFRDHGPELVTSDNSLKATLELIANHKIWDIHISGHMTGCPAYLGITINNRLDLEEIFRYDALIRCTVDTPEPTFNLTFKVPNRGQDPDKTFDVKLEDSKRTYDVYLTQMLFEQQKVDQISAPFTMPKAPQMSSTVFAVVGGITLVILFFMLVAFIYTEHTKAQLVYQNTLDAATASNNAYTEARQLPPSSSAPANVARESHEAPSTSCGSGSSLDQKQTVFIGVYIFLRIVYSLLFTFTVFFAVLMLFIDADLKQIGQLDSYQGEKYNASVSLGHEIDRYSQRELLRQGELVTSMQGACSHYIGELFDTMAKEMDNITAHQHELDMYGQDSSISYLMHQRSETFMKSYRQAIDNFTATHQEILDGRIKPFLNKYHRFLAKIYHNNWYKFPQMLHNKSTAAASPSVPGSHSERQLPVTRHSHFQGADVDFGVFLEIEEVENVQLWDIRYWEMFANSLPDLPMLPIPTVNHQRPDCSRDPVQPLSGSRTLSNHTALDRLDSSQFISSSPGTSPQDNTVTRGPRYKSGGGTSEEYKFLSPDREDKPHDTIFSVEEFITSINIELLRIVFLIMDGVLLLYRFSHTYMNASTLCRGFEDSVRHAQGADTPSPTGASGARQSNNTTTSPRMSTPRVTVSTPVSPASQQTYSTLTSRGSTRYQEQGAYIDASAAASDYNTPLNGQRSGYLHPVTQVTHTIDPLYAEPHYSQNIAKNTDAASVLDKKNKSDHNFEVLKESVVQLVLSSSISKVLVGAALLVMSYLLIKAVTLYLDVPVISQIEGFSVYLGTLDIQLNQTNWYLLDQSNHFNRVTMKIYEGQMSSELLNLKSMVEYFNSEQRRLVENYVTEACAITKQPQANWTCAVDMSPPRLHVPMLPCNFVPVQPKLYTDFNLQSYESKLGQSFEPYVNAARNIVLKTGYALFIVLSAMFVIHVIGTVVFHYLKTRHKFPVRKVFITTTTADDQRGIQNPVHGVDESEYDTDDVDAPGGGAYATYATPTRVRVQSPHKSNTLQTDFKYSETKV